MTCTCDSCRWKMEKEQAEVLVILTFLAAYCRYRELECDREKYPAEEFEYEKLKKWWDTRLNELQRDKIQRWVRKLRASPGTASTQEQVMMVAIADYARLCELRNRLVKSYGEREEAKRLEYDWSDCDVSVRFKIVKWVKELCGGYENQELIDTI